MLPTSGITYYKPEWSDTAKSPYSHYTTTSRIAVYNEDVDGKFQQNFQIGLTQIGSIFNHKHTKASTTTVKTVLTPQKKTEWKEQIKSNKTFKYDTTVGMALPQMDPAFIDNDIWNAVGYQYCCSGGVTEGTLMPYGQYIQQYNINGVGGYYPTESYIKPFDLSSDTITNNGKKFLPVGSVTNGRVPATNSVNAVDFCSNSPKVYNNGNLWSYYLTGRCCL
jgi:hypothetical protein